MELLRWKTRISVLWMIIIMNGLLFGILSLRLSGGTGGGEANLLVDAAIGGFIPFIMAWLALTLKDSANRWANLILGILYAIFFIAWYISSAASVTTGPLTMVLAVLLLFLIPLAASLTIVWYAWKWPKQVA